MHPETTTSLIFTLLVIAAGLSFVILIFLIKQLLKFEKKERDTMMEQTKNELRKIGIDYDDEPKG